MQTETDILTGAEQFSPLNYPLQDTRTETEKLLDRAILLADYLNSLQKHAEA